MNDDDHSDSNDHDADDYQKYIKSISIKLYVTFTSKSIVQIQQHGDVL